MDRTEKQTNQYFPSMPVAWYFTCHSLPSRPFGETGESGADESDRSNIHCLSVFRQPSNVSVSARFGISGESQKNKASHAENGTGGDLSKTTLESPKQGTPDIPVFIAQYCHHTTRSGLEYRYHLFAVGRWFCLSGCIHGLVQPFCFIIRSINHSRPSILHCRLEISLGVWHTRDSQHRSGQPVYLSGLYQCCAGGWTKISMDGKGRALDNVFVERLWRSVKYEDIYLKDYRSPRDATLGLRDYFHFYNHLRPHQSLGGKTPATVYQEKTLM